MQAVHVILPSERQDYSLLTQTGTSAGCSYKKKKKIQALLILKQTPNYCNPPPITLDGVKKLLSHFKDILRPNSPHLTFNSLKEIVIIQ